MADDEALRFVLELKDEFSEIWEKIKDSFEKGKKQLEKNAKDIEKQAKKAKKALKETNEEGGKEVEKLTQKMGGLSKVVAGVGVAVGVGSALYAGWTMFKNKIADVTKEAEALEATLGNILGSKGAAKNVLNELANSDLSKVFNIKEIDEGYMTLANHGLKATMGQMKAIGDLSAGTGQSFGSVINAIVNGGNGRTEAIKNLGIDVVKNKNKKLGIDDLTLSFRGQTQTIKNNSSAIQEYLLNLGMIPGVQGSMARSADTVAASENNLGNQLDRLWDTLGERFNPSVVESKNVLTKWIGTINDWMAVPIERKIGDEIAKIKGLQTELTAANTTEERRKAILKELHELQPKITDGINDEAINFQKLADNIDAVTGALTRKITLSKIEKRYSGILGDKSDAEYLKAQAQATINQAIYAISPELAKRRGLTEGQKQMEAAKIARSKGAYLRINDAYKAYGSDVFNSIGGFTNDDGSVNISQAYQNLKTGIQVADLMSSKLNSLSPKVAKMQDEKNTIAGNISKTLGLDSISGKDKSGDKTTATTSIDKGGIASVHGGGQIKNITINIQNLVSGGVNLQTTNIKEGMSKAKDIVVEGLLTAVNDANLVGN